MIAFRLDNPKPNRVAPTVDAVWWFGDEIPELYGRRLYGMWCDGQEALWVIAALYWFVGGQMISTDWDTQGESHAG